MINKDEFDLLLKEISEIEKKITELKVLNKFDKANTYEEKLNNTRLKASGIVLDTANSSNGFDELALEVIAELINLNFEVDYCLLKVNNIIESAEKNRIDAQALQKIKDLWENLENYIKTWKETEHNPIEELEYEKTIGRITLEIIIHQLQIEGVINFHKVFRYCKPESLANSIKEVLFDGAKDEFRSEERKRKYIDLAKNITDKDLYDYKIWQQVLLIKDVRSRDDQIEIIGNLQEIDSRKFVIYEEKKKFSKKEEQVKEKEPENEEVNYDAELEIIEESFFVRLKKWFKNFVEETNQKNMALNWNTFKGPAFKLENENGEIKYYKDFIEQNNVENVTKLTIASDGVAKYNFEKNSIWEKLEYLEIQGERNCSNINLSPDKTIRCVGNDVFCNAKKLKDISFGKIELIGDRAFKGCTSLTKLIFPESLKTISEDAFADCSNLKEVKFSGDLDIYILERPQNILNCFKQTSLEKVTFASIENAFNFAIADCPTLKTIQISNIPGKKIPFRTCKYRLGRQEGIVSFIGENALNLWKKKNGTIRFFELTEEDKKKFKINN